MHTLEFHHSQPIDKDERKRAGREARERYPEGYNPVAEHPVLFCRPDNRPALRARLGKQPWKDWYETLLRPLAEVALAARDLAELRSPGFALKVFPIQGTRISPVQAMGGNWKLSVANCAFVAFLEEDGRFLAKARQLLLEAVDAGWGDGGWGGEDYDLDSGWSFAWVADAALAVGYDLVAASFSPEERRRFEARLARDLEYCQTDPLSPRYNPSWVGVSFMGIAALLLGRDDCVRKVEAMLDQYVEQVLWGEGEYFEGGSYQTCMEWPAIMLMSAIRNVTGRNPAANPRWAMRAEHWIRRAGPLGTDATHSDAGLVSPTAQLLLASVPLLPPDVAGWAVWMYERIGDPGWLPLRGSDDERRRGVDRPSTIGDRAEPERRRRHPYGVWAEPSFWLMTPDPLPAPIEPPAGSYVARNAGLGCLRSDWSMDSMHTCLFAPRFYGSPHSHWDSLTFDFWAHGAYLVKNVGYHELHYPAPHVPEHLHAALGVESEPNPIKPPAPWTRWDGWDALRCFRMAPDMHNLPTIDGGGGNHWTSRADPLHFIVNPGPATSRGALSERSESKGWAQALRADGGVAGSYTRIGALGTEGRVVRTLVQVEPAPGMPGYLVVADDVVPEENPEARCDWFLHPRGEIKGSGPFTRPAEPGRPEGRYAVKGPDPFISPEKTLDPFFYRLTWTTCDFLSFPPRDVSLEVCLPPDGLEYELKPDGHHLCGGSFQPGEYLDVSWRGARRFWAVLRPAKDGEKLPAAEDLPGNLGLSIGGRDLVLVRPIAADRLAFEGIASDASVLVARDRGAGFYLAVAARRADFPPPPSGPGAAGGGIGFESSAEVVLTARGTSGAVFCDRPHKQREPMEPVKLTIRDPRIPAGRPVLFDGREAARSAVGGFELVIREPGLHRWQTA